MRKKFLVVPLLSLLFLTVYGINSTTRHSAVEPNETQAPVISAYDDLFRDVCAREQQDWRLMSAIAYHESRFLPHVVSRQGARGLMQVMPAVARRFGVTHVDRLYDPETSISLACKVLNSVYASLNMPATTAERDRMSIALACYNGGIGHVIDARNLAREAGEDPNSYAVVLRYLERKADPNVYASGTVKRFTGANTIRNFVDDVMGSYDRYRNQADRAEQLALDRLADEIAAASEQSAICGLDSLMVFDTGEVRL